MLFSPDTQTKITSLTEELTRGFFHEHLTFVAYNIKKNVLEYIFPNENPELWELFYHEIIKIEEDGISTSAGDFKRKHRYFSPTLLFQFIKEGLPLKFKSIDGSVRFDLCEMSSLEDLFVDGADGARCNLHLTECRNLTSLKGCPQELEMFICEKCKRLSVREYIRHLGGQGPRQVKNTFSVQMYDDQKTIHDLRQVCCSIGYGERSPRCFERMITRETGAGWVQVQDYDF